MAAMATIGVPKVWLHALFPDYAVRHHDNAWVKQSVRDLIGVRVRNGSDPLGTLHSPTDGHSAVPEAGEKITMTLSLPEPSGGIAKAQASALGLTVGQYFKRIVAGATLEPKVQTDLAADLPAEAAYLTDAIKKMAAAGYQVQPRLEQARHFTQLIDALQKRKVGLCEAGTGSGKTLAMLAAAAKIATDALSATSSGARVAITVPTLGLINQFAANYAPLQECLPGMPPLRVMLGRREFVSPAALQAFLAADVHPQHDDIAAWLAAGGAAPANSVLSLPWLTSSLQAIAPGFPVSEVTLPEIIDKTDPGYLAYRRAFSSDRAGRAEILLCTHAMLAQDLRSRQRLASTDDVYADMRSELIEQSRQSRQVAADERPMHEAAIAELRQQMAQRYDDVSQEAALMPKYDYLLVDEAHQFEQNLSSAMSEYLSLLGLVRKMEELREAGGKVTKKDIAAAKAIVAEIVACTVKLDADYFSLRADTPVCNRIRSRLRELMGVVTLPKLATDAAPPLQAQHQMFRRMLMTLKASLSDRNNWQSSLQCSPVRRYPQLCMGRSSVESVLRTLWDSLAGAAAVSATLYLKKNDGYGASFQSTLLGIPAARTAEYPPVHPDWLMTTLSGVWIPEPVQTESGYWLRPPTRSDRLKPKQHDAAEQAWLQDVAAEIATIDSSAAGGVLVLMTSYSSVATVAEHLGALSERLVVARENFSLRDQGTKFLMLSKSGARPIWIAVGAAWTGLDIGGHDPWQRLFGEPLPVAQDNVLTDLIIPRLPFGTNRSITHAYRMLHKPAIPWDMLETAFRMRQGIGRLVRRNGLPRNRRVFVLDARLNDPAFVPMLASIRNNLLQYRPMAYPRQAQQDSSSPVKEAA